MKSIVRTAIVTIVALFGISAVSPAHAADKFMTIGTAGVTGVYFPAGGAICRLVNLKRKEHGIKCSVESTGGSIYNLNAVRQGELDLAVVQSDWQYHAYYGDGIFQPQGKFDKLRSVFSMHGEPFTIVARADSGIHKFADLKGKRVNIGNPGSGMRATMEEVMRAFGWTRDDFALVSELKSSEQGAALCDNKVDAIVYAAGNPNGAIQEVTSSCDTKLIDVTGAPIDTLVQSYPFYSYAEIPGGMYKGTDSPVKTFGVKATIVSSADVDPEIVYQTVKAVFERFDDFKTLHPVFSTLDPVDMVFDGNTAPLHEGAKRYFKESGLLEKAEARRDGTAPHATT
ncbi:MAG: TAXI family TRAP transporter solute-binding subunit, partial [Leptospiraceae bacterium]|nr:TAXI family TRAP transporter solute-binding subunit [Leptospiraceae bacterium]